MSTTVRYGIRNIAGDATRFYPDAEKARDEYVKLLAGGHTTFQLVKVTTEVLR